jgi:hypothetical protein
VESAENVTNRVSNPVRGMRHTTGLSPPPQEVPGTFGKSGEGKDQWDYGAKFRNGVVGIDYMACRLIESRF